MTRGTSLSRPQFPFLHGRFLDPDILGSCDTVDQDQDWLWYMVLKVPWAAGVGGEYMDSESKTTLQSYSCCPWGASVPFLPASIVGSFSWTLTYGGRFVKKITFALTVPFCWPGFYSSTVSLWLCNFRQIVSPLCASTGSSVKWIHHLLYLPHGVVMEIR